MEEKASILIVDDDESTRRSLELIFRKKGYEIETAVSGQEALERSQERYFNAALLDIKLPDMEGLDLLSPLKRMHPDMVLMIATAYGSLNNVMKALNEGVTAYIIKPLNMDEVLSKLRKGLKSQRLAMENVRLLKVRKQELTERKKVEAALKSSINEKEALLKEIHHRVKNNMQIVYSLLNLQSGRIRDKNARNILQESQNRIKSIALLHERLYHSKNLAMIEFADYIRKLVLSLFNSYGINQDVIKLNIDAESIFLGVDIAIPCGLIVNELVTNSLRHAFPSGKRGEISIGLRSYRDKEYKLSVHDNGVGFPENLDFRNTESLGLQLVNTLVEQLEGSIILKRKEGTTFGITFKE